MSKKWILTLVSALSATAYAGPAKPSIARATKDAGFTKKVQCKPASPARTSSQTALYMNTRTKEIVSKKEQWLGLDIECRLFDKIPGYPKAYRKFDGTMSYKSLGGPWSFDSWKEWDTWLEGMPPLDRAVIDAGIADRLKVFSWNFLTRTVAIHSYGIRKDAPMMWKDVNIMKVDVDAEVDARDGSDLVRYRVVIPVMFVKETPNGAWETRPGFETTVELSRRKATEPELKMDSVIVSEKRRLAAAKLASLPSVDIPAFATAADARAFVYKQLLEAPAPNLESALRRMSPDMTLSEDDINAAVAGQTTFKEQYCGRPVPKKDRPGFINKDDSSWVEINVSEAPTSTFKDGKRVPNGFVLNKLALGLVTGDRLAALKSYSYDLCSGTLPKASGSGQWKVGDRVEIKYIGSWQPGEIVAIVAGKLYVHDKRRDETKILRQEDIRDPQNADTAPTATPAAKAPEVTTKAPPSTASLPFAIGDRVEGNYGGRGKWYKGTIKDFNSAKDRAFVKYDDGTSEYLKFDQIRKQ